MRWLIIAISIGFVLGLSTVFAMEPGLDELRCQRDINTNKLPCLVKLACLIPDGTGKTSKEIEDECTKMIREKK